MRYIYLMIGMISFGLGFIGIVLPILPTTPFLLLAGYCFARSSKRVHNWFVSTKAYQRHLEPFVQKRAMTLKTKICITMRWKPVSAAGMRTRKIRHRLLNIC